MVVTDMIQIRFDASVVRDEFKVHADFQLPAGSTTALVGPNGAGKSTVLAAIAGLEPAHSGEIEIGGVVVDAPANAVFVPSRERNVGVVFQQHLLFPHLSVLDNVAFGLRSRGLSKADARSRAMDLLQRDELHQFSDRHPDQLSGGQAQRVALVRALAAEPEVLMLDEPLSALDVEARVDVRNQLSERLKDFDGAVLLVTHDPVDTNLPADPLILLEAGASLLRRQPSRCIETNQVVHPETFGRRRSHRLR